MSNSENLEKKVCPNFEKSKNNQQIAIEYFKCLKCDGYGNYIVIGQIRRCALYNKYVQYVQIQNNIHKKNNGG